MPRYWLVIILCITVFILLFVLQRRRSGNSHTARGPNVISESEQYIEALTEVHSSIDARQAFDIAHSKILDHDEGTRFTLISTGNIHPDGRSDDWELFFDFPQKMARANVRIALSADWDGNDPPMYEATVRILPFSLNSMGELQKELRDSGTMSANFIRDQWQKELENRQPLPVPFTNSDEVLHVFRQQDAPIDDLEASLTGTYNKAGKAVWKLSFRKEDYSAPFEKGSY